MSQFPEYSTVYLYTEPNGSQISMDSTCLPQIWTRLAMLEKQVFGVAQQPPYPVPATPPVDGA